MKGRIRLMKTRMMAVIVVCGITARGAPNLVVHSYGIYQQNTNSYVIPQASAPDGYVLGRLDGFERLLCQTNYIPAEVGIRFGFKYSVRGFVSEEQAVLRLLYKFPKMKNPESDMILTRYEGTVLYSSNKSSYMIYMLENQWECVPGSWEFEVWYRKTLLYRQVFILFSTIKKAEEGA